MKIAVDRPEEIPISLQVYFDAVSERMKAMGTSFELFGSNRNIPADSDIYWNPFMGFEYIPRICRQRISIPVILTIHGTALFSMKITEYSYRFRQAAKFMFRKALKRIQWRNIRNNIDWIITVSENAKREILNYLPIPAEKVIPIYHGIDTDVFNDSGRGDDLQMISDPYFLHLSVYQPKKNIERIMQAYLSIATNSNFPDLIIVSPHYPDTIEHPKIKLITDELSRQDTAAIMSRALAFVFPSLHETFGLPIIESMACGLPVITSNLSACKEIAGDAAILVDPRNHEEIAGAMTTLAENEALRLKLKSDGLGRAEQFSWDRCAEQHHNLFERAIKAGVA
jgi:glycosyltransferase involved in cell wall biosynthesis